MTELTLALEGSTYAGSVALIRGSEVIADVTLDDVEGSVPAAGRGERMLPAVAECMKRSRVKGRDIARIVCGAGPGRFTSLRVAGAVAKGLATGYNIDLYAVSSLLLIVAAIDPPPGEGEYLAVLDAMRGECFAARVVVTADGVISQRGPAEILSSGAVQELSVVQRELQVVGSGQRIAGAPHARGVSRVLAQIIAYGPVHLPSWEPDYGRLPEAQVKREAAERARP
jgi:tRNA threonylcarbamoyl adenosine modification protein YeaZ